MLPENPTSRAVIDVFRGYNRTQKNRDGEFWDTVNLSTEHYPNIATRRRRCMRGGFTDLQAIIAKDSLCWVDNGTLYVNGSATGLTGLQTAVETQLVSMGAYICVFPDKKYLNTRNLTEYGDMGAAWRYTGAVTYRMCGADGIPYENVTKSADAPQSPDNGDVWIDQTSGSTKVYSSFEQSWTVLETVYTRLDFTTQGQVPTAFREMDGVSIEGAHFADLNGSKILYALGGDADTQTSDWIVLVGIQETAYTDESAVISITRSVPDMDFVCEAQNRLWGCRYGFDAAQGKTLNELYCCALGDFKNWEQYLGTAADSWRASCGTDGPWTGCINYLGKPVFMKEDHIHEVYISARGAHAVNDMPARGVQQGSHKSLAVVGETLYYKARPGVMAYQGGMPISVSDALGDVLYSDASAGVVDERYYISMMDGRSGWHLYVYDAGKDLWIREDSLHASAFARVDDELYCIAEGRLYALCGTLEADGETVTREASLPWRAETGLRYYEQSGSGGAQPVRYVSRYDLRLALTEQTTVRVFIEYDSDGVWRHSGTVRLRRTGSAVIPIRPRRCDHFRLRLEGEGDMKLLSIARVFERGSDV